MPSSRERTPTERETLVFPTPEAAQEFRERVGERLENEQRPGIGRTREIVGDELAREFAKEGEHVQLINQPWEHTPAEHEEVQGLVDVAFAKDLPAAVRQAKTSPHYPRNLDLLHDLLTGEMYDALRQGRLNQQPAWGYIIVTL